VNAWPDSRPCELVPRLGEGVRLRVSEAPPAERWESAPAIEAVFPGRHCLVWERLCPRRNAQGWDDVNPHDVAIKLPRLSLQFDLDPLFPPYAAGIVQMTPARSHELLAARFNWIP